METPLEVPEPQTTPEGSAPTAEEVTLARAELDDLKHKAEVSSQNFERAKKAELRVKELEELQVETPFEPDDNDISSLKAELADIKNRQQKSEVLESYPKLKELWSDFEEFRSNSDNKGMNMRTAAKAFLVEKELLEPQRKGLEKPTGGPRVPLSSGMSVEDVKHLRETDFKKYLEMTQKGLIKIG